MQAMKDQFFSCFFRSDFSMYFLIFSGNEVIIILPRRREGAKKIFIILCVLVPLWHYLFLFLFLKYIFIVDFNIEPAKKTSRDIKHQYRYKGNKSAQDSI